MKNLEGLTGYSQSKATAIANSCVCVCVFFQEAVINVEMGEYGGDITVTFAIFHLSPLYGQVIPGFRLSVVPSFHETVIPRSFHISLTHLVPFPNVNGPRFPRFRHFAVNIPWFRQSFHFHFIPHSVATLFR